MFKNTVVPAKASDVFRSARKLMLVDPCMEVQSWSEYLKESKSTYQFLKEEMPDLTEMRKQYESWVSKVSKTPWKSLSLKKHEKIEVINYGKSEVVFTRSWNGEINYVDDLVLDLYEEKSFVIGTHLGYFADIYSPRKAYVPAGGPDHLISGVKPGTHQISLRQGMGEKIIFNRDDELKIGNAKFWVVE